MSRRSFSGSSIRWYGTSASVLTAATGADRDRPGSGLGRAGDWQNGAVSIRVFLLDDHELVREGIRQLLESDEEIEVVGEATTAAEAVVRIPLAHPDVAILDVRLEDGSGIEVCRDMRSALPDLVCLMLTSYADDEALYASVMAGASGYVLKRIRAGELIEDVKKVAGGASLMDPRAVARVVERIRKGPEEDPRTADLSPRSGGYWISSRTGAPTARSPQK